MVQNMRTCYGSVGLGTILYIIQKSDCFFLQIIPFIAQEAVPHENRAWWLILCIIRRFSILGGFLGLEVVTDKTIETGLHEDEKLQVLLKVNHLSLLTDTVIIFF